MNNIKRTLREMAIPELLDSADQELGYVEQLLTGDAGARTLTLANGVELDLATLALAGARARLIVAQGKLNQSGGAR